MSGFSEVSFTDRLGDGPRKRPKPQQLAPGWNDPVPPTRAIAASYGLCNVMFGTKRCSCQKARSKPCAHMLAGVEVVAGHLAWWS